MTEIKTKKKIDKTIGKELTKVESLIIESGKRHLIYEEVKEAFKDSVFFEGNISSLINRSISATLLKEAEYLNQSLKEVGIRRVYLDGIPDNISEVAPFKELTLIVIPATCLGYLEGEEAQREDMVKLGIRNQEILDINYKKDFFGNCISLRISDRIEARPKLINEDNFVNTGFEYGKWADYYPNQNLIITSFKHLVPNWRSMPSNLDYFEDFIRCWKYLFKKYEIKTLDEKSLQKIGQVIPSVLSERFEYSAVKIYESIKDYKEAQRRLSNKYNDLDASFSNLSAIARYLSEEGLIKKQLDEIKKLPFIYDFRNNPSGISFKITDIKIVYKGDIYSFGDFTIKYSNGRINIFGDASKSLGGMYHPHVGTDRFCAGTYLKDLNELVFSFRYKEFAILMRMFLQTYNETDNYMEITRFKHLIQPKVKPSIEIKEVKK
jgi:hypothetical protein